MTRDEYESARDFMADLGFACPSPAELPRGGIVGVARCDGIVKELDDPWFFGPKGLLVSGAQPVDLIPASGHLDFFEWKRGGEAELPAKWMLPKAVPQRPDPQGWLL